jgi:hypothetical protein
MLTDAFNTLNIVDKYTMFLADPSAVPAEQRNLLEASMQLLTPKERADIQKKAQVIQPNSQKWLETKYDESLKSAVMKLQQKWRSSRRSRSAVTSTASISNRSDDDALKLSSARMVTFKSEDIDLALNALLTPSDDALLPTAPVINSSTSSSSAPVTLPPSVPPSTMPTSHAFQQSSGRQQSGTDPRQQTKGRGGRGLPRFPTVDEKNMKDIVGNLNIHSNNNNNNNNNNNKSSSATHPPTTHQETTHRTHQPGMLPPLAPQARHQLEGEESLDMQQLHQHLQGIPENESESQCQLLTIDSDAILSADL